MYQKMHPCLFLFPSIPRLDKRKCRLQISCSVLLPGTNQTDGPEVQRVKGSVHLAAEHVDRPRLRLRTVPDF